MEDYLTRIYKILLSGAAKLIVLFIFIGLVIFSSWAGFGIDFGSCFGRASCTNNAGMYFLLFPVAIIFGGIFLLSKWRAHQKQNYKEAVKDDVRSEMGYSDLSQSGRTEAVVIELLNQYGELTLNELTVRTKADKDELLIIMRSLLLQGLVGQELRDGTMVFFSKAPAITA